MSDRLELAEHISRDHALAANAAGRIAAGVPIREIEAEPLEALADWISFELQDRDTKYYQQLTQHRLAFIPPSF